MLRLRTAVRAMPAVWFGTPIVALSALYATSLPPVDGYGLAASAAGSASLPFIAAYVCATAAWEGSRLVRGRVWLGPWSRSSVAVALPGVAVPALFGLLALLAGIGLQLVRSDTSAVDLRIIGVGGLDLLAWAVVGLAIGVSVPLAAAVPLALMVPFAWLGFVPALHPVWLRHLTGMYRDCCLANEDLAPSAMSASVLSDAGFIVAASLVARARPGRRGRWLLAGGGVAVIALFAATTFVSNLGFAPTVARDPASLVCSTQGALTVCVWPERTDRLEELASATADAVAGWRADDLAAPSAVTESQPGTASPGSLSVSFADVHGRDAAILALAHAAVPPPPICPGPEAGVAAATTGGSAQPYLEAWLAAAAGLSSETFAALYSQVQPLDGLSPGDVVERLVAASPAARRGWVAKVTAALTTCDPVVPDVTVGP